MTENRRLVHATPEQVWDVISDGWLYAIWVVGAARMREVDDTWPAVGSRLHHSVGPWPLLIDDNTEVLEVTPGQSIVLRARAWPLGEAHVHIRLDAAGAETEVHISEEPASGPAALLPAAVYAPGLKWRNSETLRRLAYVAERRP